MLTAAFLTGAYFGAVAMGLVTLAAVCALQWLKHRRRKVDAAKPVVLGYTLEPDQVDAAGSAE